MSESMDAQDKYVVPGLERGLRLLAEFSREQPRLSAPELGRRLNLPRSTIFRLLATLERLGFVERDERSHDYRLGMGVLRLGFEYLASLELTELGQPILRRLVDTFRQAANLVVRDERHVVYVAKLTPPSLLSSSITVGSRLPAHATVLGRVLLQDMTLPELEQLYHGSELQRYSAQTPATVADLHKLLQQDRDRDDGAVLGEAFFEPNICTIAAPVRDRHGLIVAALGLTIPDPAIAESRKQELLVAVREAADELSGLLDHVPTHSARRIGQI